MKKSVVKKAAALASLLAMMFVAGCAADDDSGAVEKAPEETTTGSKPAEGSSESAPAAGEQITLNDSPVIFLAGDSTVKTYADDQWIGGWGQYLSRFLDSSITVKNCANGGRSSRSFINEGRLYKFGNYTFSENGGIAIGEQIKEGDYLFVQFGHNDDDTKEYPTTLADRQVGLGTPDANGIFPVTPGKLVPTTYIPAGAQPKAGEIEKYGPEYYSYNNADGSLNGTYKWYLKQYIDFARSKKAVPVLVTPVCRVSFDASGKIKGGPGLHGDNFAYVQAVRQLAEEEDCLLIDLFAETVKMQEAATPSDSDGLMAIVPNELKGEWPASFDAAYKNADLGYQKMEGTHYNKYGAFITAAKLVENIMAKANETHLNGEKFSFVSKINKTPEVVVHPNIMSKTAAARVEALCTEITVTPASREYPQASAVVAKIAAIGEVTAENYAAKKTECEEARKAYNGLNVDDRSGVSNLDVLTAAEKKIVELIEANRPKASKTVIFNFEKVALQDYTDTLSVASTDGTETISAVGTSAKKITTMAKQSTFKYAGVDYNLAQAMSMGGSAGFGANRYIEFTLDKAATVTVVAQSSSASADRVVNMVKKGTTTPVVTTFDAGGSLSVTTREAVAAGTYQIGSAGSGLYIVQIIIEYFN